MKDFTTFRRPNKQNSPAPQRHLLRWGAALFWLVAWQLGAVALGQPLLLPTPVAVLVRLVELAGTVQFWLVTVGSLLRILLGFLLGLAVGCLLAVLTSVSRVARAIAELPLAIIKATPVASFVILALLFIRGSYFSVFISFLMVLPMAWGNVTTAIAKTDPQLLEVAELCRMSRASTVRHIYLPSVLPYLLASARTGLGFAWKAGVAGEVIAIPPSAIGTQLYNAKVYLETTDLFAWTATIIALSLLLEWLVMRLAGGVKGGEAR